MEIGPTSRWLSPTGIGAAGEEHSCLVKDFSDGGVRLQLNGFEIPDDFALFFAPNELARSGRYKVVWRLGKDVGAKLISLAPLPAA